MYFLLSIASCLAVLLIFNKDLIIFDTVNFNASFDSVFKCLPCTNKSKEFGIQSINTGWIIVDF